HASIVSRISSRRPADASVRGWARHLASTSATVSGPSFSRELYSAAHPKSFTSVRRNRPAHDEESSQWPRTIQMCGCKGGVIMTIAEYIAATALVALILWAVLGLLIQEI